jgi:uncharacterized protein YbaR (Trm112 family)
MFVELIEALRCPRPHEETQLVVSATRTEARHIVEGVLGCPVCGAEFAIHGGVAQFDAPPLLTAFEQPDADVAMRLAAFLELTDASGFALLCGRWGVHVGIMRQMADTPLVLVNPSIAAPTHAAAGALRGRVIPFAASSARALALDETSTPDIVASGVRAVRAGGRVLGPSAVAVPPGVTELVRDERVWVGEKNAASDDPTPRLVSIKRAER